MDFALTFGDEDQKQKKGLYRKCTPVASVLLLSFGAQFSLGGHILTWDTKASFGTDFALTFGGEDQKQKKGFYRKCIPVELVLLLSFGAQFSLGGHISRLGGGANSKLGGIAPT